MFCLGLKPQDTLKNLGFHKRFKLRAVINANVKQVEHTEMHFVSLPFNVTTLEL